MIRLKVFLGSSFLLFTSISVFAECSSKRAIIAETAPTSNYIVDTSREVVTDTTTGLMWKMCLEGLSGTDCTSGSVASVTFSGATTLVDDANTAMFAGYDNWRLPNIKELRTTVEEQCRQPAFNEEVFPNVPGSGYVFSNTPRSYRETGEIWLWLITTAQGALYPYGVNSSGSGATSSSHVRLVRNAQ